jgi:hypothetical protein
LKCTYSLRKQRLEILFDFLTEARLIPWSIAYWKRGLSGVPLHGSTLDMNKSHNIEVSSIFIVTLQNMLDYQFLE